MSNVGMNLLYYFDLIIIIINNNIYSIYQCRYKLALQLPQLSYIDQLSTTVNYNLKWWESDTCDISSRKIWTIF